MTEVRPPGYDEVFVEKLDPNGTVQWAKRMGGVTNANASGSLDIAVDVNGVVYVTGNFDYSADFGPYYLTSAGGFDTFVTKLNTSGTVQWAKRMGSTSDDSLFKAGIAVDAIGASYVTGNFQGTATFGSYNLASAGLQDIFVEKLDANGTVQWAKRMGSTGDDRGESLAVDDSGDPYVTGRFSGTVDFGSYTLTANGADIFVTRLNGSGTVQWANRMGGTGGDAGYGIAVTTNGGMTVTGFFANTADFGPYVLTSAGYYDVFVARLGPCPDTDADGLCDSWEADGIDTDGDGFPDLQLWDLDGDGTVSADEKANPNVPDVYVEVDWMAGHGPNWDALNQVVESFRQSPTHSPRTLPSVRLHIQHGEQAYPHSPALAWVSFGVCQRDAQNHCPSPNQQPDFATIKDARFGIDRLTERGNGNWVNIREAKRMVFHYALFVHGLAGAGSTTGVSEPRSNDFVVSLGALTRDATPPADLQAGTFMHELGHNLGLLHGGGDGINCKPNYLSVMSYTRQSGKEYVKNRPLDYSDRRLPTLSELNTGTAPNTGLNEPTGIGGRSGDRTVFGPPYCTLWGGACENNDQCGLPPSICVNSTSVDASGAINWNRDWDSNDLGVTADINHLRGIGECPESLNQLLDGYDDWGSLIFNFRNGPFYAEGSALAQAAQATTEPTAPEERDFTTAADGPDDDADGVANIFDNCDLTANPDQADFDADGAGNACDCAPLDLDVYPGAPEINDGKDNQCPGDDGYQGIDEIRIAHYQDSAKLEYSWYSQEGATLYNVARSSHRNFTECTLVSTVHAFWGDAESPAAGTVFYYLVRAGAPNVGTWGRVSAGGLRTIACGP